MNQLDMTTTRSYSLTIGHVGKVSDMAEQAGVSQGEIVRRAIDLLWGKMNQAEIEGETGALQPNPEQ